MNNKATNDIRRHWHFIVTNKLDKLDSLSVTTSEGMTHCLVNHLNNISLVAGAWIFFKKERYSVSKLEIKGYEQHY